MGFTWFYWVLPSFTGLYRVLLGFTGFYWVLLGFTGFYWDLLGFANVTGKVGRHHQDIDDQSNERERPGGQLCKWRPRMQMRPPINRR